MIKLILLSILISLGTPSKGQTAPVNSGIAFSQNGPCTPTPSIAGICGDQLNGTGPAFFTFYTHTGAKVTLDQLITALTLGTGPQGPQGTPGQNGQGFAVGTKITYSMTQTCSAGKGTVQSGYTNTCTGTFTITGIQ